MKKMLALLMALMMALGCFGALAEEEAPAMTLQLPNMTITEEVTIDAEAAMSLLPMFGVDESMLPIAQAVIALVNNATEQTVIAGNAAQFELFLKGAEVLNVVCGQTENGFALASDLIPSYTVTVSNETVQQLMEQLTSQLSQGVPGVDMNQLMEKMTGYIGQFAQACTSAVTMGEPEKGEFVFEELDYTFNTKMPVHVDTDAIKAALQTLVEQIKNDETFNSLISAAAASGANVEIADETTITLPEVVCNAYANTDDEGNSTDGVTYVITEVVVPETEESEKVNVLVTGDYVQVSVEAPAQDMSLSVLVAPTEAGYAVDCDLTAQGMYVGAKIELANGENMKLDAQLFFMNPEKPLLTASAVVIPGGEVTLDLSGEGKENIDLAQLMQDEDGTLKNNLLMDVMSNGLNGLMARAAEIMPEEVSSLITLLMGGGQEAVEAPAAE